MDDRLHHCLDRLRAHVEANELALTGGVALSLHLPALARLVDIDFVARHMEAVRPSVTRDFLVSHRHIAPDKPIVQLVDPQTRLRIDVFPDRGDTVARALTRGGWRVVTAEDSARAQAHTLARPVDAKHWRDAVALSAFVGSAPPPRPAEVRPDVYRTDLSHVCERCARSRSHEFPIAPKQTIFDLLGYL